MKKVELDTLRNLPRILIFMLRLERFSFKCNFVSFNNGYQKTQLSHYGTVNSCSFDTSNVVLVQINFKLRRKKSISIIS